MALRVSRSTVTNLREAAWLKYMALPEARITPEDNDPPVIEDQILGSTAVSKDSFTVVGMPAADTQVLPLGTAFASHTQDPVTHDPLPLQPPGHPLPI